MGFGVKGLGFMVRGLGFSVEGPPCRVAALCKGVATGKLLSKILESGEGSARAEDAQRTHT